MTQFRLYLSVAFALIAFAGNSVLCRLALLPVSSPLSDQQGQDEYLIDPNSFTALRLISGALTLWLLMKLVGEKDNNKPRSNDWRGAFFLFTYAIAFSFAYVSLGTGVGALVLFGSVQITMILYSVTKGHKPQMSEWLGLIMAFGGLIYLVAPTLATPSVVGFILMVIAGIAWGAYTIAGKTVSNPLLASSINFTKTLPFVAVSMFMYLVLFKASIQITLEGATLALVSGCFASGIGYAVWYAAVKSIDTVQSAVLQLLVPIIAAVGGVIFANEDITFHLVISSLLILGGVLFVLISPKKVSS